MISKDPLDAEPARQRAALSQAKRVVVKVGTRVLVDSEGRPSSARLEALATDLAAVRRTGREVILVTSGAIGAGMETLGLKRRPKALPELQTAAAVGQSRLMSSYERLFGRFGDVVGQVLLTHDDLRDRGRHLNARNTMLCMLRQGVLPIVNENDVVSADEIKFGDNDVLAALVTSLVSADTLILLSTTDGLRRQGTSRSERVPFIRGVGAAELALVHAKESELSTGGMGSKLRAAQTAVASGARAVIADGRLDCVVQRVLAGEDIGTLIANPLRKGDSQRKLWIAFFNRARGSVFVDDGARRALERQGKSLLPIGVSKVEGRFSRGDVANIRSRSGELVGRGLVEYSSEELAQIAGLKTAEITDRLGHKGADEAIHRDNLVLFGEDIREVI